MVSRVMTMRDNVLRCRSWAKVAHHGPGDLRAGVGGHVKGVGRRGLVGMHWPMHLIQESEGLRE